MSFRVAPVRKQEMFEHLPNITNKSRTDLRSKYDSALGMLNSNRYHHTELSSKSAKQLPKTLKDETTMTSRKLQSMRASEIVYRGGIKTFHKSSSPERAPKP